MKNKIKLDNSLIKRKNLILLLNKEGITRINPKALDEIEKKTKEDFEQLAKILSQKIIIKGKKTLEKEDVEEFNKEKKYYPEI
jgi:histone H3/H4